MERPVEGEDWRGLFGEDCDCDCRERGASMKVATRPEAMCHSMWQWKSQTRLICVSFGIVGNG